MIPTETHLLPSKGHRARGLALAFLICAPFIFGVLAVALGQDANWDLRNYHFYNPYAFLNGRYGFDLLPSQTPYFYNPLLDVPFYFLTTHLPAIVAGYIVGFVQGLNFILLFMLAYISLRIPNPRQKVIACAVLAALGMLGGGGIALIGTTFYDNVTSLGVLTSALLVVRYHDVLFDKQSDLVPPPSRGRLGGGAFSFPAVWDFILKLRVWRHAPSPNPSRKGRGIPPSLLRGFSLAFLFGIPAGLMMGLKLPAVIFCLGLCFALLFAGGAWPRRFVIGFGFGLGVLVGMAITYGYWGRFLQSHFGSPFFPYFNDFFKAPLAPPASARDTQFVPRSVHDFVLFPFVFTDSPYRVGEIPWRDWRILILYVLLPLILLLRLFFGRARARPDSIARPEAARYLLWVAVISYGAWLAMFCVYRYAIPLEMLAPLLLVFAVDMLPLRIQTRGILAGLVLLVIAASIQPGNWTRRASWLDHFVEAEIPPLGDTSNLMILMAGFEPYSHLITQFPPEIPFVRIQSNFASPDEKKGINVIIRARVDSHKGRFLLLIPPWQHDLAKGALPYFNLGFAPEPCQTVIDRLYDDKPMDLCRITRLHK